MLPDGKSGAEGKQHEVLDGEDPIRNVPRRCRQVGDSQDDIVFDRQGNRSDRREPRGPVRFSGFDPARNGTVVRSRIPGPAFQTAGAVYRPFLRRVGDVDHDENGAFRLAAAGGTGENNGSYAKNRHHKRTTYVRAPPVRVKPAGRPRARETGPHAPG